MAEREKEVIVTNGGGGGTGAIIAIVLLIAVLIVLFLVFGRGLLGNGTKNINATVKIETPSTNH